MGKFDYRAKSSVSAVQWRGDNLDEMRELLDGVIEKDSDGVVMVYADWIEPYFFSEKINNNGYYVLKTEGDEFDPGMWVVVYEDGDVEGMEDTQFNKMFEKV